MNTGTMTLNSTMTWGAAPFVLLSLASWLVPESMLANIQLGFVAYSALIYSFMTGTLWGGALTTHTTDENFSKTLAAAIAAFLFALAAGVLAFFLNVVAGLLLLMVAYAGLPTLERIAKLNVPTSYRELRGKINKTVVITHVVIIVHAVQPHAQ